MGETSCTTITHEEQLTKQEHSRMILRREIEVVSDFIDKTTRSCQLEMTSPMSLCQRVSLRKLNTLIETRDKLKQLYKESKGDQFGAFLRFGALWLIWGVSSIFTHGGTTVFILPGVTMYQKMLGKCNNFLGDMEYLDEHLEHVTQLLRSVAENGELQTSKHLRVDAPIDYHTEIENTYQLRIHYLTLLAQQRIIQEAIDVRAKTQRKRDAEAIFVGLFQRVTLGAIIHDVESLFAFIPPGFGHDIINEISSHLTRDAMNSMIATLSADVAHCVQAMAKYKTIRALLIVQNIARQLAVDVKFVLESEKEKE